MADMYTIVLSDPEIMGRKVLKGDMLLKVVRAVEQQRLLFRNALVTKAVDADYLREKLDERLRSIIPPEHFAPFLERYDWLEDVRYEKRR